MLGIIQRPQPLLLMKFEPTIQTQQGEKEEEEKKGERGRGGGEREKGGGENLIIPWLYLSLDCTLLPV